MNILNVCSIEAVVNQMTSTSIVRFLDETITFTVRFKTYMHERFQWMNYSPSLSHLKLNALS